MRKSITCTKTPQPRGLCLPARFIGIEAGYVDLGGVSEHDDIGNRASLSGKGWTAGLEGHFNPTEKWYISARAGLFLWTVDASATLSDVNGAAFYSGSEHHTNGYAGIGTGVDFNRHWSLGIHGDYYQMNGRGYDIDTKVYSANLEYRF